MKLPQLNPVNSSHIEAVGYDATKKKLFIKFNSGHIWHYTPVTEGGYHEFLKAESVGTYFHKHIKTNSLVTAKEYIPKK